MFHVSCFMFDGLSQELPIPTIPEIPTSGGEARYKLANESDAILKMPFEANGYLIMDHVKYPAVESWNIQFQKNINSTASSSEFETVYELNLLNTYYSKVSADDHEKGSFVTVTGYDENGAVIIKNGPILYPVGTDDWNTTACNWGCIGKDYVYGLWNVLRKDGPSGTISMGYLKPPKNSKYDYYYEWVDAGDWVNWSDRKTNYEYYNVQNWSLQSHLFSGVMIQLTNVKFEDGLNDASGGRCQGTVYGVRKSFGPWQRYKDGMYSTTSANAEGDCNLPFVYAANRVNLNRPKDAPPVSCDGYTISPTGVVSGGGGLTGEVIEPVLACIWVTIEKEDLNGNIYTIVKCIFPKDGDGEPGDGEPVDGDFEVERLVFTSFDPSNPVGYLEVYADSAVQNGEVITLDPNFQLENGIYSVGVQFKNKAYKQIYFDVNKSTNTNNNLADALTVSFNPVPVIDNFNLSMTPTTNLSFKYELFSNQGELILTRNYQINQNTQDLINVPNDTAKGILINRFTFQDGSVKTVHTYKQ
jgi:hypothetical protein